MQHCYQDLITAISSNNQNMNHITVVIDGDYYPGTFMFVEDDDRLDEGHLVITVKEEG